MASPLRRQWYDDVNMRTLLFTFLFLASLSAQQPPAQEGGRPRRPMPEPKNLKVLKVQASELMPIMQRFNASLGVKCDFCHVKGDFASDEKHEKEMARGMIGMTEEINAKFPDGKVHVGCFTCHRGEKEPQVMPPAQPRPDAPKPPA